jgi:hypothetical protein
VVPLKLDVLTLGLTAVPCVAGWALDWSPWVTLGIGALTYAACGWVARARIPPQDILEAPLWLGRALGALAGLAAAFVAGDHAVPSAAWGLVMLPMGVVWILALHSWALLRHRPEPQH